MMMQYLLQSVVKDSNEGNVHNDENILERLCKCLMMEEMPLVRNTEFELKLIVNKCSTKLMTGQGFYLYY